LRKCVVRRLCAGAALGASHHSHDDPLRAALKTAAVNSDPQQSRAKIERATSRSHAVKDGALKLMDPREFKSVCFRPQESIPGWELGPVLPRKPRDAFGNFVAGILAASLRRKFESSLRKSTVSSIETEGLNLFSESCAGDHASLEGLRLRLAALGLLIYRIGCSHCKGVSEVYIDRWCFKS